MSTVQATSVAMCNSTILNKCLTWRLKSPVRARYQPTKQSELVKCMDMFRNERGFIRLQIYAVFYLFSYCILLSYNPILRYFFIKKLNIKKII